MSARPHVTLCLLVASCQSSRPVPPPAATPVTEAAPPISSAPSPRPAATLTVTPAPRFAPTSSEPASGDSGYESLALSGSLRTAEISASGEKVISFPPIYMSGKLAHAQDALFLRLYDVSIEPGSEVNVYFVDHQDPGPYNPANLIGTVATSAGGPSQFPIVTLEVSDFEANGVKYSARAAMRDCPSYALALVIRRGSIQVGRLVLSNYPGRATIP